MLRLRREVDLVEVVPHVGEREHDALGVARAAGRVLEEGYTIMI